MLPDEIIHDTLTSLNSVFSDAATHCVRALFGKPHPIAESWKVVDQLNSPFMPILMVGSASQDFGSITLAATSPKSLCALLGKPNVPSEMVIDALGEFVNTFSGLLCANPLYREHFGTLTQAVPVLVNEGQWLLPFIWGIEGCVRVDGHRIYVGYSIRRITPRVESSSAKGETMKKPRVVIIDDSRLIIEKLVSFFSEELKWDVVATGSNGNEAISLYQQHQPDLLTIDISMPEKRGTDAIQEIIAQSPDARILVVSAVKSDEMISCLSRGARSYVEKPLRFHEQEYVAEFKKTLSEVLPGCGL